MPRSPGRAGYRWRRLVASLRKQGATCAICGHQIDLRLKWPDPMSFSVDHTQPLSRGGAPLDPANARPAHLGCNSRKGNRVSAPLRTSRPW
ncbi:HNH endonuclease [Goodfellowiella coeruleoviolacea]|uniref:HNH endonuclease n=1 Tax=Goodfellowiella coeruleoviolacea TaxID=334858 RepID=A0AAE3GI86_9PSEU|nr:HNH endonuclease [Goodfellowiella coeruleoviolacea]MCP2168123.1 HNH endonuclease [Goodfellowiella coeruleoviolacea]